MLNQKGQGSLEYLLILGGAILVAVIVISAITLLPQNSPTVYNSVAATCLGSGLTQTTCENVKIPTAGLAITTGGAANTNCGSNTVYTASSAVPPHVAGAKSVGAELTMACCLSGASATSGTCTIDKTAKPA